MQELPPHSSSVPPAFLLVWTSCSTSGRRVHMSLPRGKKSRPTSASKTLDFPLLWLPITATCGSSIVGSFPTRAKISCSLFTVGITEWPSGAAAALVEKTTWSPLILINWSKKLIKMETTEKIKPYADSGFWV